MRIYFNDDHTKYVINKRVNLDEYHEPEARELYDWIEEETDKKDQWDAVPWEAYDYLCDLCGVDEDECEDPQDLMDKCLAEIEKEEALTKKKAMYYVQVWPYGVGCGNFSAYAFETEKEAEDKLKEENTSRSDYKEMQSAFGNNFCVIKNDGSVCSRKAAIELNRASGGEYKFF